MTKAISREIANHCLLDKWIVDRQNPKNKRSYAWIGLKGKKGREVVVLIKKEGMIKRLVAFVKWLFGAIKEIKSKSALLENRRIQLAQNAGVCQTTAPLMRPADSLEIHSIAVISQTENKTLIKPALLKRSPSEKIFQKFLSIKGVEGKSALSSETELFDLAIEMDKPKTNREIKDFESILLKTKEEMGSQIVQLQYQRLSDLLVDQFGKMRAKEIIFKSNLFPEFESREFKPITQERVDQILLFAETYYYNVDALKSLSEDLIKIAGEQIAEKILSNVKIFRSEYFTGRAKVTDELIEKTKVLAYELKSYTDAEETVKKIKQACESWMPIDEKIIEDKFHLSEVLRRLSSTTQLQMKLSLHKELMRFFLKKRLKEPHKLISPKLQMDAKILAVCGLISGRTKEEERLGLLSICKKVLEEELEKFESASSKVFAIDEYRKQLKELTYRRCLIALGVNDEQTLQKYQILRLAILKQKWMALSEKETWIASLPQNFPASKLILAAKMFEARLIAFQVDQVDAVVIKHFSEGCKKGLSDHFLSIEAFKSCLCDVENSLKLELSQISAWAVQILTGKSDYQFLQTYGQYVVHELIQGYELNDEGQFSANMHLVNGDGVCWAKNRNLVIESIKLPGIPLKNFHLAAQFTARDRFLQADYQLHVSTQGGIKKKHMITTQTLEKSGLRGYEEKRLLKRLKKENEVLGSFLSSFVIKLEGHKRLFKRSEGWINLSIASSKEAHTISIRLDEIHHSFALYDSNIGLLDFSRFEKKAVKTEVYKCLKALIAAFYPDTTYIDASLIMK